MSKIRLVLVSVSTVLVLCLGLFSARTTSWAAPSSSAVQSAPATETAPASSAGEHCNASADADEDGPLVLPAASCPAGTVFVKCPCGGEGCRPRNISPANWCGC